MSRVPRIRFKDFEEDWEQRKLGEVAIFSKGVGYSKSDLKDSGIPIILYGRLYTNYEIVIEDVDTFVDGIFGVVYSKGGEIITPSSGETSEDISIASVVKKSGILIGGDLNIIYPQSFLNPIFIAVSISNGKPHKEMAKRAQGKSVVHLHNVDLSEIEIDYPSIDEQTRISSYFITLDRLITLHQRKLEKLKIIKKSMLENLFPQNGEKTPKIRFSGFTKDWEQRKLGEIAERIIRKNEKLESTLPLTISAQYGLIDQNEFFDKRIASKDVRSYYLIKKGEFAYNKSTSVDAPLGAIKRLDKYKNGVLSTLYILFKIIDDTSTSSDYLVTYYATDLWHRGIQSIAAEGARNHGLLNIAPNDFFETILSIPLNVSEQKKVGDFFMSLDRLITLHQSKLEKLQKIKKSMLESMFV